jgi:hypothetical protein
VNGETNKNFLGTLAVVIVIVRFDAFFVIAVLLRCVGATRAEPSGPRVQSHQNTYQIVIYRISIYNFI